MKKTIFIFLLFFVFIINVSADTERKCSYSITINTKRVDIDIIKNADNKDGEYKLVYTANGSTSSKKITSLDKTVYFMLTLGGAGSHNIYILPEQAKKLFESDTCLQAYTYNNSYGYYITTDRSEAQTESEDGEEQDIGTGEESEKPKEEKACSYTFDIDGKTLYAKVIKTSNDTGVEYIFEYGENANTESKISNIGMGKDISFLFKKEPIRINKEQVKKLFESDTCLQAYSYRGKYNDLNGVLFAYIITTNLDEAENEKLGGDVKKANVDEYELTELDFNADEMTCEDILGPVLTKIVRSLIKIFQIVAAIIAIVFGMLLVLPAVVAKDEEELRKVSKKLVNLAIILAIILILGPIVRILGTLLGYDVTCIM